MQMGQDSFLYFDTDSIVYVHHPTRVDLPTGNSLGNLTNEFNQGQYIREFVSLRPKSYAYETNDHKTVVKIKGFTINGKTKESLNFSSMLHMLENRDFVTVR